MSKKDSERDPLSYLETPTAAFPIGSLGLKDDEDEADQDEERTALRNLVEDLDLEETRPRRRAVVRRPDERETEVMFTRAQLDQVLGESRSGPPVRPVLLALSLLGGGVLAVGVVAVVGMWLL